MRNKTLKKQRNMAAPILGDLSNILNRLVARATMTTAVSFLDLVKAAQLDPSRDFIGAALTGLDLKGQDLREFNFTDADVRGTDFRGALLDGVSFRGADVTGTLGIPSDATTSPDQVEDRRLLRVTDIMHTGDVVPLVKPDAPMAEAILIMTAKSFGCVGACGDDGRLIGIITDGDLRRHMDDALLSRRVSDIMHRGPKTVAATALVVDALGVMVRFAITALFVVDDHYRPVGFLHIHDCLRAGVAVNPSRW